MMVEWEGAIIANQNQKFHHFINLQLQEVPEILIMVWGLLIKLMIAI
jgi:hypothetical protein